MLPQLQLITLPARESVLGLPSYCHGMKIQYLLEEELFEMPRLLQLIPPQARESALGLPSHCHVLETPMLKPWYVGHSAIDDRLQMLG
mmetsp:Transcript_29030/g.60859  ORF Transcript_29030/g.60859 Transcript_29030/m.60859 type:complete len:88 (-) Transcript_29030:98-361(-)